MRHHGDREVGPGLVDLAVNVQRPGPPGWLRDQLAAGLDDLGAYPDDTAATAAVARRHARPVAEVLVTSGAAEAFSLLARALRPGRDVRHAVVVHPQFTEPEVALRTAGHAVEHVLLQAADGFRLDPAAVPASADLVVLGNPTNPTSVLHDAAAVRALVRPGRMVVVDEAFLDAVPGEPGSLAGVAAAELPGVVVARSLTKAWGLAGLRAGYLLGPADVVAACRAVQPPWSVSSLALLATRGRVQPAAIAGQQAAAVETVAHRTHLVAGPRAQVVEVEQPVAGPFGLLQLPGGAAVRERLRALGFAVRRGDTFPGLGPDWLRVAVRAPEVTDAFLDALRRAREDRP
ncbi:Rv2231c family pyridoxal phosphate-dependent protein CobC [Angustibacter aerolatus]